MIMLERCANLRFLRALFAILLVGLWIGCSQPESEQITSVDQQQTDPEAQKGDLPYRIVKVEDFNFANAKRVGVKISLPRHYSEEEVRTVARAVVEETIRKHPVNAIGMLFYGPNTDTSGSYDVASVDWGPNGRRGDAGKVASGQYQTFRYSVTYNPPRPVQTGGATLRVSDKRGHYGVPLPSGATLIKRFEGDASRGRDPYEIYSIKGSAAQIKAFFESEMPRAGWQKTAPFVEDFLFYRKGRVELAIGFEKSGGKFSLMGS